MVPPPEPPIPPQWIQLACQWHLKPFFIKSIYVSLHPSLATLWAGIKSIYRVHSFHTSFNVLSHLILITTSGGRSYTRLLTRKQNLISFRKQNSYPRLICPMSQLVRGSIRTQISFFWPPLHTLSTIYSILSWVFWVSEYRVSPFYRREVFF